jgi:hypothetical protein
VNSRDRRWLSRDLQRAYEIIVELEDMVVVDGGGGEHSLAACELSDLRDLIAQLWQRFRLSGEDRVVPPP